MSHLLAIDLGTGSCRAILFDEDGRQVAAAQREWSHPALPGFPGSQVFETARNWPLVAACVRQALAESGVPAHRVAAVSSTSMREGMVLYDAAGREIWACPNVDSRASAEADELVRSGAARRIFERGGDWVAITSPARFLWIRDHEPEVFRSIAHVGMLSDWVLYRLTGRFVTDPSSGSSSNLFDLGRRTWSPESLAEIGLSPGRHAGGARAGLGPRRGHGRGRGGDRPRGRHARRRRRRGHAARAGGHRRRLRPAG